MSAVHHSQVTAELLAADPLGVLAAAAVHLAVDGRRCLEGASQAGRQAAAVVVAAVLRPAKVRCQLVS